MKLSLELSRRIIDDEDCFVFLLDTNKQVCFVNEYGKRHSNISNESLPVPISHILDINDVDITEQQLSTLLNYSIKSISFICRVLSETGFVWVKFTGKWLDNSKQELLLLTGSDISEHMKLQAQHDKLLKLINSAGTVSNIGHWQLDINTKHVFWSDEIYKIHGVTKSSYYPKLDSAINFYHPDDVDKVRRHVDKALDEGKEWYFSLRIVRPNGEVRHIISNGNVHISDQGKPDYIFGIFQDITEQRKLMEERNLLQCAVLKTIIGVVMTDANRKVQWVNEGFENLTGYTLSEIKGENLAPYLQGEETSQDTVLTIQERLRRGKDVDIEILNYRKDGKKYWNKLIITPIFESGELVNFVGIQHDITNEVLAKKELLKLNDSLEQKVTERTLELERANQELRDLAMTDPLTGALNRRTFYDQFDIELKRVSRNPQSLSLAMLDIDFFKRVNDKYGHQAGDYVLVSIVNCIRSEMRDTDYLFRMGGEEFLLLMPNTDSAQSFGVAERIRKVISDTEIEHKEVSIKVTISIGVVSQFGDISASDSLKKVDEHLYRAKSQGRNCVISDDNNNH